MQQQSKDRKALNSSMVVKGGFKSTVPQFGFNPNKNNFKLNSRTGSINRGRR